MSYRPVSTQNEKPVVTPRSALLIVNVALPPLIANASDAGLAASAQSPFTQRKVPAA